MRLSSLIAASLCLCLAGSLLAQNRIQSGKIKRVDTAKGLVVLTVDGKDQEFTLAPNAQLRDADNQNLTVAAFKEKPFADGTNINFIAEKRDDGQFITAMRAALAGDANTKNAQPAGRGNAPPAPPPRESIGVKPLTELGDGTYKGETGGLYGDGKNEPPAAHQEAARRESAKIQPLDSAGKPSPDGKIGLLAIGMSNTTQEFSMFMQVANADPQKSPKVVLVDGAQGGKASEQWIGPDSDVGKGVWGTVESRMKSAGVTDQQVQVVWLKQAIIAQGRLGEFPAHAKKLESDVAKILQLAKQRFPNLHVAYLSSRIYGGYATGSLNPEPYAYEGAFSMRWVIQSQIKGDSQLNFNSDRGPVTAPLVLWGPYLWGDGTTARKGDGFVWTREDLAGDGTHPSDSGRRKVANLLLTFFKTDPYAKTWFVK